MIKKTCPCCNGDSYSSYDDPNWKCPYCGKHIPKLTTEEYFFYEWLIVAKNMSLAQFKQLKEEELLKLRTEYEKFKQALSKGETNEVNNNSR